MAPAAASSSSSTSKSTYKPTASSSRAVQIPDRSTLFEEQFSNTTHNSRSRHKHGKVLSRAESRLDRGNSSDSSSPPSSYLTTRPASQHATARTSSSSSFSSSFENAVYEPSSSSSSSSAMTTRKLKAKAPHPSPANSLIPPHPSPLGPSMASSASYRSINLNSEFDGTSGSPPHLITYTKTGQGFNWNEELFLPSYMMGRDSAGGGRRRRRRYEDDMGGEDDEVMEITEIFVSDEEARAMMP